MTLEQRKTKALNEFINQYPETTSADWQAFILGVEAMIQIQKDIELEDLQNESELNSLETQSYER